MRVEGMRNLSQTGLTGRAIALRFERSRSVKELFALFPDEFAEELSTREDVFFPALVMAALVNREDLDLGGMTIDPLLLRNCLAAARQHQAWVPRFRRPEVTNYIERSDPRSERARAVSFFSGGVDSLFTLLRHSPHSREEPTRLTQRDIALAAHIFHNGAADAVVRNPSAEAALGKSAAAFDARFVPVFSNIMTFDYEWSQNYARVTHAAGLASIARLLSADLSECLIASSHTYGQLHAWGSSPIVDPLYSDRHMSIRHDGSTFTRFEKTEFISRSATALKVINVCDRLVENRGYVNCSRCQKCLRSMTALDLCGKTGADAPAFDWTAYTPRSFGEIYLKNWSEVTFARELVDAATARGRTEIARGIRHAIFKSSILSPMAKVEDGVRHIEIVRQSKSVLLNLRAGTYRALGLRR